ncbi:hypothetical protein QE152_g12651 [Popillia japonica]|uniref:Uncharacterized protein n=1 Tax=Popillia japonica TaxID=7064 RepID=A0AAW1LRA6_POPJA
MCVHAWNAVLQNQYVNSLNKQVYHMELRILLLDGNCTPLHHPYKVSVVQELLPPDFEKRSALNIDA